MFALEHNLATTPVQLHVRQCKQGYRQGQCSRTRLACGDFCAMGGAGGEQASRAKKQRRIQTRIPCWLV